MKKITKTFLSIAAVSALTAAMAVSASAMSATYADGVVTLSDVKGTGASQTMMILSEDTTVTSENANTITKAIDQKDDSTVFVTVPVGELANGTYYVRIGGTDASMQTCEFIVGGGTTPSTRLLGDVDNNTVIDAGDVTPVVNHALGKSMLEGDDFKAADTDKNTTVDAGDVTPIINYALGKESNLGTATIQ